MADHRRTVKRFPKDFLWGAATSAHQVEGKLQNDWRAWEVANANRLAKEAPDAYQYVSPVWKEIEHEATAPANYLSGRAADQAHRYQEDVALMRKLHLNAYRFSIDWARVEPEEGTFSQAGIQYYIDLVRALRSAKIEPMVTLWHWPLPLWLRDKGGWEWSESPQRFARFAKVIADALGNRVRLWNTLNEVNVYATFSYLTGSWPPAKRNVWAYERVLRHLADAHRLAYQCLKTTNPQAQVGIAHSISDIQSGDRSPLTALTRWLADWSWNRRFLNMIRDDLDFIGANCYFRNVVRGIRRNQNENRRTSDLGWELYPASILGALQTAGSYGKPVYITENGLADRNDAQRAWYIAETLRYVHQAIEEGIDVRGYFHWSLLDNFEWDKGFWPRFGLIDVNRKTLDRTIRPSAYLYAKIARSNALIAP